VRRIKTKQGEEGMPTLSVTEKITKLTPSFAPVASAPDHSHLPGFDHTMHKSGVVDEFVEVKDGRQVVVYRTKPEITLAALRRFRAQNLKF
jgi:hypothetical protein